MGPRHGEQDPEFLAQMGLAVKRQGVAGPRSSVIMSP